MGCANSKGQQASAASHIKNPNAGIREEKAKGKLSANSIAPTP